MIDFAINYSRRASTGQTKEQSHAGNPSSNQTPAAIGLHSHVPTVSSDNHHDSPRRLWMPRVGGLESLRNLDL